MASLKSLTCVALLLAVFQVGALAAPITLNFDAVDNAGGTICLPGNELLESGFRVQATAIPPGAVPDSGLCAWYRPAPFNPDPTGASLYANYPGSIIQVERLDGQSFSLLSIDIADIYNYGVAGEVRFVLNDVSGTSDIVVISLDLVEGLQTITFGETNLRSFSIESLTTPGRVVQFDNVRIDSPVLEVPTPGTFALSILSIFLLGGQIRRRRESCQESVRMAATSAEA